MTTTTVKVSEPTLYALADRYPHAHVLITAASSSVLIGSVTFTAPRGTR